MVGPEKKRIGYNVYSKTYYMMESGRRIIDIMNTIKHISQENKNINTRTV